MNRTQLFLASLVLAAAMIIPTTAAAQAPAAIPFQGFLTSDAGAPVDGATTILVALYSTVVGGAPLFTESQSVMVEGGFFSMHVGDVEALDLALFRDNSTLFVGVSINGGSEMSPRIALGTVPFAAYAEHAGNIAGGVCAAGEVVTAVNANGTVVCGSALDCTTVSTTSSHSSVFMLTASCATGYTVTGGGHNWSSGTTDVWFFQSSPSGNGWRCRGTVDRGGASSSITCSARCCADPVSRVVLPPARD